MPTQRELKELLKQQAEDKRKEAIAIKEKLIIQVQENSAIWDRRLEDHRKKDVVECLWGDISTKMGLPKEKCKSLWKSLVDSFRTHFNTVTYSKSGQEFDDSIFDSIQWTFFKQLLFLKDVFSRRETSSNFPSALESESSVGASNTEQSLDNTCDERTESSNEASTSKKKEYLFSGHSFTFQEEIVEDIDSNVESESEQIKPKSSEPQTTTKRKEPSKTCNPSNKKRKSDNRDPTILDAIQATNKALTKELSSSERFGEYVIRLHEAVPENLKLKCEMEVIQIMYQYSNSDST